MFQSRKRISYALVDVSGTLHDNNQPIQGAVEAIERLMNELGPKNVVFLTNTTTISRKMLHTELVGLGFLNVSLKNIITSSQAVCHYVQQNKLNPYCFVESNIREDLDFMHQQNESNFDNYDSVLVGLSPSNFHYEQLNTAFRILHRQYCKKGNNPPIDNNVTNDESSSGSFQVDTSPDRLLCFHNSYYVRGNDGELSLGPGGFIDCMKHACYSSTENDNVNRLPVVLGKPSPGFYEAALSHLAAPNDEEKCEFDLKNFDTNISKLDHAVNPNYVVMIGDDYRNDILGARKVGVHYQVLVQTGKYQAGDEIKCSTSSGVFRVVPSIVDAVHFILEQNKI